MGNYIFRKPQMYVDKIENERWADIPGFIGIYQISSIGRIQNVKSGKLIKTQFKTNGYIKVDLSINASNKTFHVHRLVAAAFIENPLCYPEVNHLNGVKSDNRVENLEWSTRAKNNLHAYSHLGRRATIQKAIDRCKVPIEAKELKTGRVLRFRSISEASLFIGVSKSCVADAADGKQRKTNGFTVKRLDTENSVKPGL